MIFLHDKVNTIRYYTILHIPIEPNYDQGVETNIAKALLMLADAMAEDDYREKLSWILNQIPETRIDIELTPYQDAIMVSAVFTDDVDATAFKLRWV